MIRSITLEPFGHFTKKKIYFTSGINLIYAGNEEGKTTLYSALQAGLLGFLPAGRAYPYFPWDKDELYLRVDLFDGRTISRKITSGVSGFLEEGTKVSALANRPLDGISRSYVENFHLLEAENLYKLKSSTLDEIIENHLEKLYQEDGPSYSSLLADLDERKKEIYKKRGSSYRLYDLDKKLGELTRAELLRKEALIEYKKKEEELAIASHRRDSGGELEEKTGVLQDIIKNIDQQIQARSEEAWELKRLENLKAAHENSPAYWVSLILFIVAFILGLAGRKYFSTPWPGLIMVFFASMVFYLVYSRTRERQRALIREGFYSWNEFLESYRIQSQLDLSLEELLSEKRKSLVELELLASERKNINEDEVLKIKVDMARLEELIDSPLEDREELLTIRQELIDKYNHYDILKGLVEASYEEYKTELLPHILEKTSLYLSDFTGGEYIRVLKSSQGNFVLEKPRQHLEMTSSMSKGLRSQFYLALRLAIIEILDNRLPIFYDEAFSNWDDSRLTSTLESLSLLGRQQFIFTCKKNDLELYEDILGIKRVDF